MQKQHTSAGMKRSDVRKLLLRHRGSITEIASELGVSKTSVSDVLRGRKTSARIEAAASEKAVTLMQEEQSSAA